MEISYDFHAGHFRVTIEAPVGRYVSCHLMWGGVPPRQPQGFVATRSGGIGPGEASHRSRPQGGVAMRSADSTQGRRLQRFIRLVLARLSRSCRR